MEQALRDQVTQDRVHRPFKSYGEVQQGSLLVELSASLRRRLATLEAEQQVIVAYRAFAHAAHVAGHALIDKHGIPFVPDAPFQWSKLRMEQVHGRLPEIHAWAAKTVVAAQQALPVRHTALDLCQAGLELQQQLQRERDRGR